MNTYPNQKTIIVEKENDGLFINVSNTALQKAMCNLKNYSFKLWLYIAKNQDQYTFGLSKMDCEKWGINKSSYHGAIQDLIDKGYLKKSRKKENTYYFSELPYKK